MNTVYIVAGGPSLKGYDFSLLKDKRVIAVNKSFKDLPNAEVIYFSDKRFFDEFGYGPAVMAHPGRKVTGSKLRHDGVENYKLTGHSGLSRKPGHLKSGNNSGYTAINLAYHMGAEKIILLGFDMKFADDGSTHYHDGYPTKNTQRGLDLMKPYFEGIAEALDDMGILVLNANMDSEIDAFERIPLEVAHLV